MQRRGIIQFAYRTCLFLAVLLLTSLHAPRANAQGQRTAGGMTPIQQRMQGPGAQGGPSRGGPPGFQRRGPGAPRAPGPAVEEDEEQPAVLDLSMIDPATRDPFWPVGFLPKSEEEVEEEEEEEEEIVEEVFEPKWDEAQKGLEVRGTMKIGAGNVANINDQIVQEGETISVDYEGYTYVWLIKQVAPDSIQMDRKEYIPQGGVDMPAPIP